MASGREVHDGAVIAASIGVPERFREIFERHFAAIYTFTARRLGPTTADDVAASVFVEAFEGRARFAIDQADSRPWLYGIATNLIRRHRRTETRRLRAYARASRSGASPQVDVDAQLDAVAMGARLASALRSLGGRDRDALLLYAWADLTYVDIARATGVPVGTVRSRIHRARQKLRSELGLHEPLGSLHE